MYEYAQGRELVTGKVKSKSLFVCRLFTPVIFCLKMQEPFVSYRNFLRKSRNPCLQSRNSECAVKANHEKEENNNQKHQINGRNNAKNPTEPIYNMWKKTDDQEYSGHHQPDKSIQKTQLRLSDFRRYQY